MTTRINVDQEPWNADWIMMRERERQTEQYFDDVVAEIEKHLPGLHDQKEHGRKKRKKPVGPLQWGGITNRSKVGDVFEGLFISKGASLPKVAEVLGGNPRRHAKLGKPTPIDVETDEYAVELKTMNRRAKRRQVNLKAKEVESKQAEAERMGKPGALVAQIVDLDAGAVHLYAYTNGFTKETGSSRHEPESQWDYMGQYDITAEDLT